MKKIIVTIIDEPLYKLIMIIGYLNQDYLGNT